MSVPVYVYVPVVLILLSMHLFTVWYALRKVRELQAALVAKRVLLREPTHVVGQRKQMAPGDIYVVKTKDGSVVIDIVAHNVADISIRSFV